MFLLLSLSSRSFQKPVCRKGPAPGAAAALRSGAAGSAAAASSGAASSQAAARSGSERPAKKQRVSEPVDFEFPGGEIPEDLRFGVCWSYHNMAK